jgi:hypothetical protein
LYGPPKKAVKLSVPKKLQGIQEIQKKIWINEDILQVSSGLSTTLKFHVTEVEFREAMHFPGAILEERTFPLPQLPYIKPNPWILTRGLDPAPKDESDFMMLYECLFCDIRLHYPFSDFQVQILTPRF